MNVEIKREDRHSLPAYACVPIAFEIRAVVDAAMLRIGHSNVTCRPATQPRTKDYDSYPGNDPLSWVTRFAIDDWVFLAAYRERVERVGGAAVVCEPDGIAEVGGRPGYAVLWDLRVTASVRGQGVGSALLSAAEAAAHVAGCRGLEAETQDINAAACRLYAANGFMLSSMSPAAYHGAPTETKLVWTKRFV